MYNCKLYTFDISHHLTATLQVRGVCSGISIKKLSILKEKNSKNLKPCFSMPNENSNLPRSK